MRRLRPSAGWAGLEGSALLSTELRSMSGSVSDRDGPLSVQPERTTENAIEELSACRRLGVVGIAGCLPSIACAEGGRHGAEDGCTKAASDRASRPALTAAALSPAMHMAVTVLHEVRDQHLLRDKTQQFHQKCSL